MPDLDGAAPTSRSNDARMSPPSPRRSTPRWLLCVVALAAVHCAEHRGAGVPPAQSTATMAPSPSAPPPTGSIASSAPSGSAPSESKWTDAVRFERWDEAAALLDALPDAERARAEMRYVRARVALARGDKSRVVELLTGLDRELPLLSANIARYRAEAAAEVGPFAEAAAYFARSSKSRDQSRAAVAYDKASDAAMARRCADKAVSIAQKAKSRRDEAAARLVRGRILLAGSSPGAASRAQALSDLRWVSLHPGGGDEAHEALELLEHAGQPLSTKERIQTIDAMNEAGRGADALVEIDRLADKSDAPHAVLLHAKAMALYASRDFDLAAKTFQDAAQTKSGREPEQLFYAARALARAEHDDEAIKAYEQVASRWPKTFWSERSTYLAARLMLQNGRFKDAATMYAKYQASYPKGEKRDEVRYEKALAQLSSDGAKAARATFAALAHAAHGEDAGRLHELEGVAALRAGQRDDAVRLWNDVIRSNPLSWAALTARARLEAVGASVPPLLEPGSARSEAPLDVKLPATAKLLLSLGLDGDAESWLATNERELTASYAGRESEALCTAYGALIGAKRRYRIASAVVSPSTFLHAPSAAERWAWECYYPRPYATYVDALEQQHGIPKTLVTSVMRQESGFDPAIASYASAVGLMQLLPVTAKRAAAEMGLDVPNVALENPALNLRIGAFYLGKLIKMFDGSVVLAAASYNAGPKAVSHWLETASDADADLWVARIPYEETRNYVARVLTNLAHYRWLAEGDAGVPRIALSLPTDARAPADAY